MYIFQPKELRCKCCDKLLINEWGWRFFLSDLLSEDLCDECFDWAWGLLR